MLEEVFQLFEGCLQGEKTRWTCAVGLLPCNVEKCV